MGRGHDPRLEAGGHLFARLSLQVSPASVRLAMCVSEDCREQNELQFSIRSVCGALRGSVGLISLLVSDNDLSSVDSSLTVNFAPSPEPRATTTPRIAQVPAWLNLTATHCVHEAPNRSQGPAIQLVTHSEIFRLPSGGFPADEEVEAQWQRRALPSFNSKNIESRIGWIPHLVRPSPQTPSPRSPLFRLQSSQYQDMNPSRRCG